jgi:hypothetical protein
MLQRITFGKWATRYSKSESYEKEYSSTLIGDVLPHLPRCCSPQLNKLARSKLRPISLLILVILRF